MTKKRWLALAFFIAAIVALDQWTKALVRANIPYGGDAALIPGVVRLTYVRNTGAAFSMLGGARWFFLILVAVFFAVVGIAIRKRLISKPAELWCLAAIGGGALGNAVDRAISGEVTDMIEPLFVDFAVFNVADIFITCGAVALAVFIIFFDRGKGKNANTP
jgi:signal peptidase II